jgi:drug/metabolite transporter (DMT)-like permease
MLKANTILLMLFVVLAWGSAFPLLKVVLTEVSPMTLGLIRFLVASPFLVLYAYVAHGRGYWRTFVENPFLLILMGLTGVTGYNLLQNLAAEVSSPMSQSIIISSNPMMVALLSAILLKEKIGRTRMLGIAIGFAGVLTIVLSEDSTAFSGSSSLVGDLLNVGAALSWALYSVLSKKLTTSHSAIELTATSMVFGTLFFVPVVYLRENPQLPTSLPVWLGVAELSLIASCLAYAVWNYLLSQEDASRVSISLFLIPVVSTAISVTLLSEPLSLPIIVGMIMVIIGVLVAERSRVS